LNIALDINNENRTVKEVQCVEGVLVGEGRVNEGD
jgi:hypothetical protein